jgi:hypothetical protein
MNITGKEKIPITIHHNKEELLLNDPTWYHRKTDIQQLSLVEPIMQKDRKQDHGAVHDPQ